MAIGKGNGYGVIIRNLVYTTVPVQRNHIPITVGQTYLEHVEIGFCIQRVVPIDILAWIVLPNLRIKNTVPRSAVNGAIFRCLIKLDDLIENQMQFVHVGVIDGVRDLRGAAAAHNVY
ncbi:hypothetical protein ES703_19760 [subsurface metagenome]